MVERGAGQTNALLQSGVNFTQRNCAVVSGIIEGQNDFVVVDKNRIEKCSDQLLLTVTIMTVHGRKPMQEDLLRKVK